MMVNFVSSFQDTLTIGIVGSVVASSIFLFLLFALRPSIKISDCISHTIKDGIDIYRIKIVNNSFLFELYDVHAQLVLVKSVAGNGGFNHVLESIKLSNNHIWYISRRSPKRNDISEYAVQWTIKDDLSGKLNDSSILHFKIFAKHSLSGFPAVKTKKYHSVVCIKSGAFYCGTSMAIG